MSAALTYLGPTAVHAASFEVINLNDAGAGSLRAAIAAANGTAGPDTITFASGVTGAITLSSGQLTISDSLRIVGPGRGALTVDGNAASRVFDIPLSPGDVNVSISGLTVSNGKAQTGGGIRVQDESLSLDDVALTGNSALGNGGGLYADGFAMTLTVRNSTISGNAARGGGGVYIEDTKGVTVFDGVVFNGNTASENGGGIFLYDPDDDVVINNATITNNVAKKGGGIYLYSQDNGSVTISNSSISGNNATTGGGIYLYDIDHPVSISHSTISGNTATNGAGINIDRISAPAVISNSTISGNSATGAGGGVRLARGGGLTITHSTITANSATNAGGARFPGPVSMSHVIIAGNTAGTTADLHAAGGVTADFSMIGAMIGATTDGGGNKFGVTDPMLGPLANNGGPTLTHFPLANSPAIDAGNPAVSAPATDQRGLPRRRGIIDIGAVEVEPTIPTISINPSSFSETDVDAPLTISVSVKPGATNCGFTYALTHATTDAADFTQLLVGSFIVNATSDPQTFTLGEIAGDNTDEPDEMFTITLTGTPADGIPACKTGVASADMTLIDDDDPPPTTTTTSPSTTTTTSPSTTTTTTTPRPTTTTTSPSTTTTTTPRPTTTTSTTATPTTTPPTTTTTAPPRPIPPAGALTATVSDATVTEGDSGTTVISFRIGLSGPAVGNEVISFRTIDGTAMAGSDFTLLHSTYRFSPGETSVTIDVIVKGDTTIEGDESFTFQIKAPTNLLLGRTLATGTIDNDDGLWSPVVESNSAG